MVGLDILGLEDSHVVVFALEIRNGLHNSALQVLEQLLGEVVGLGIPKLVLLVQEQQVQEEVVVLGVLLVQQLPGPSNLLLRVCKTDTGRIRIPSRWGFQRSSRHRRNILPLPE